MVRLRKKPKPADEVKQPEPEAQAVTVEPPALPPVVEYKPPMLNDGLIQMPRTPEEIIHNLVVRQLEEDRKNPPPPEPPNPAIVLLKKVQAAKDTGQPLAIYAEEAAKMLQGLDAEEKLTDAVARHEGVREIADRLEVSSEVRRFLKRMFKAGKMTISEAMIYAQMNSTKLELALKSLATSQGKSVDKLTPEDFASMDWSLQMTEQTSSKALEGTTPQGREIIRKITIRARRKLFKANVG